MTPNERPAIYSPEAEFPDYLKRGHDGRLYFTLGYIEKVGPWDMVVDFGQSLENLRQPAQIKPNNGNWPDRLIFVENMGTNQISREARNLTLFANRFELTNPDVQLLYTLNFMALMRGPLKNGILHVGKMATILAPERGAGVIKLMLEAQGFTRNQMPFYQASRVMVGNNYTVALRFDGDIPKSNNVLHVDDCGAAGGTEWAGLAAYEAFHKSLKKYASVVGVGVVSALERRARELTQRGDIDWKIFAGGQAHSMNSHFYLTLTSEERRILGFDNSVEYRVGDMGNAMELDSRERRNDLNLLRKFAGTDYYDGNARYLTDQVTENPHLLNTAANQMRKLLLD